MPLGPGTRLGPYEIQSAIGAGGMGEVYRARDTRLDRVVAIKVLPAHVSDDPASRERFEREARTVAALNHPHICTLHDVGHQDGVDFLVMEHLDGETLAQRMAKGPLPLDAALRYAIEIADALDKAHRAGIVHRDLKPGNVMLTRQGAKLLDFGLAKVTPSVVATSGLSIAPTLQTPATLQGTILGTLQYMAPEQIEGQEADARTDVFAFGCVLYEMLTGKKAFEGRTQASLIGAILERQPPTISTLLPVAPPSMDWVVNLCLAKEADERWQSAGDLKRQLQRIAGSGAEVGSAAPAVARSRVRAMAPWSVAAVAVLGLTAALVIDLRRPALTLPIVRFDITTPPTRDASSFAISPDGQSLVFVATLDGASKLWLRQLEQTAPVVLAGTDEAMYPFWSPDSRSVGFFADGKLKRVDIGGGAPQTLARAPSGRGGTWNRDDVILFTPDSQLGSPSSTIMRVAATGGAVTPVTHLSSGHTTHRWPQFLPDGRRFLFFSGFGPKQGTYLGSLDGGEPSRIIETPTQAFFVSPMSLLFLRQDTLMTVAFDPTRGVVSGEPTLVAQPVGTDFGVLLGAFSASTSMVLAHRATIGSARRQLVWVDRDGMPRGTVGPPDQDTLTDPELSPDGRRVAVRRLAQGNLDVWVIDVQRAIPTRFTFDPSADAQQIWSPDGARIVFSSNRGGTDLELFEKASTGASEEHSLGVRAEIPESWSPDGRFLLFVNNASTGTDLWALPMTGDRKAFPVVQTRFDERRGQFSPDGRWVSYESNESGVFEIYVRGFPGSGGKWQISTAGGTQARWRRDGKELFYIGPDGRMMAAPIATASDGQTLNVGQPVALFMTHLATGSGITANRPQYDVAADGRFLLNTNVDDSLPAPPITIVQNWQAALKK